MPLTQVSLPTTSAVPVSRLYELAQEYRNYYISSFPCSDYEDDTHHSTSNLHEQARIRLFATQLKDEYDIHITEAMDIASSSLGTPWW